LRIVVLCATDRGLRALEGLRALAPEAEFLAVTYPETPHEPPFVERIRAFAEQSGCQFAIQTNVAKSPVSDFFLQPVDLMFCFSWRFMVPPSVYESTRLGSYVIHDSLLPRYRGFSPSVWALMNGEKEVGVTLFEMAEEVDSGRIVGQEPIGVTETDDIGTIREKGTLAVLDLLHRHFPRLVSGEAILEEQDESDATYCCKWTPADARIQWSNDAESILNLIRAVTHPYPGAFCFRGEDKITVWKAEIPSQIRSFESRIPGAVSSIESDGSVCILTGSGEIRVREASLNNGPAKPAREVITAFSDRLS